MDIEEVKCAKSELEEKINDMIIEFQTRYGLRVNNLRLTQHSFSDILGNKSYVATTEIEVIL